MTRTDGDVQCSDVTVIISSPANPGSRHQKWNGMMLPHARVLIAVLGLDLGFLLVIVVIIEIGDTLFEERIDGSGGGCGHNDG